MVNTTILRRLEVVNGNVIQVLYTYIGVYTAYAGGWIELLTKVHGHTPPEQGPTFYKVLAKDVEHALVYHLHGLRGKRIRLYKATVREDGEIVVDTREGSIHATASTVNGYTLPIPRHASIPTNWYIYAKVDNYPDEILVKYYYEPTGTWHTVPIPS